MGFILTITFPNFSNMINLLYDSGFMLVNRSEWPSPMPYESWIKPVLYATVISFAYFGAIFQIYVSYRFLKKRNRLIY